MIDGSSYQRMDGVLRVANDFDSMLGPRSSPRKVMQALERTAEAHAILICGKAGTDEVGVARLLRSVSSRSSKPFVPVDCAALSATLAESQLFGHERKGLIGINSHTLGAFRAADQGIVFLNEVGDIPLELQPSLLRTLQRGEVIPVGATHPIQIDVLVIAATTSNLEMHMSAGRFRKDLYNYLSRNVVDSPSFRPVNMVAVSPVPRIESRDSRSTSAETPYFRLAGLPGSAADKI